MSTTIATMISESALRQHLRETYGPRMYRIRADGSVEAYMTPMANTNRDGWAFIGGDTDLRRELVR